MILQRNVLPDNDKSLELYYRVQGTAQEAGKKLHINARSKISSDTYMNAFDVGAWKKYTEISDIYVKVSLCGKGELSLIWERKNVEKQILEKYNYDITLSHLEKRVFLIPDFITEGILYVEIVSEKESLLHEILFETAVEPKRKIKISLVICTYKRKTELEKIINCMKEGEELKEEWINIKVIDNASEIENSYGRGIEVCHNPNTGGSGGFLRGMEESINSLSEFAATHILLMDDDVCLQKESIYRLCSLLSYIKKEYQNEVIAGRMFRKDLPEIQYTALEIWNQGDIKHIGWNCDMTVRDCLWRMNDNTGGEYGGWWFSCFSIEFVKKNRPLPFFLHCDDVEYGLRHGGTPIILNGIQVWHETYEYRQSPMILYYDIRNSLIVNAIYGWLPEKEKVLAGWKNKISEYHVKKDYLAERMLILGMLDFSRGGRYFGKTNMSKKNERLNKKKRCMKMGNSILWRLTELRMVYLYQKIVESYKIYKK